MLLLRSSVGFACLLASLVEAKPAERAAISDASNALKSLKPQNRAAGAPFVSPLAGGGSQLDIVSPGLGEPMNVIVSGLSDSRVLTDDGFLNWAQSLDM